MASRSIATLVLVLASSSLTLPVFAQDSGTADQPRSGGWRKFGDASSPGNQPPPPQAGPQDQNQDQNAPPPPPAGPRAQRQTGQAQAPAAMPFPGQVTLPAGTWVKLRVDQPLSSDHSMQGEGFTATLTQPLVADGLVVARRGQTVAGRVTDAVKAGRAKGTSRLGIELSELSLVDGRQVPIHSQLVQYQGGPSKGRDATAIATTTGVGAAIGAAADGGFGAGMGAIAGAVASTIGVLVTRGHATEIYPETELTFRLEQPVVIAISETQASAFQSVQQQDYERTALARRPAVVRQAPVYPPYYGGYGGWGGWGGWGYPAYYGPSLYFYSGPRYYGGWGRRGYRRW